MFFNIIALIVLFILFILIIFKNIKIQSDVTNLDYSVFKPLFPFELTNNDPFKIMMYHKNSPIIQSEKLNI